MLDRTWLAAGLVLVLSGTAWAQVVECPGAVPVAEGAKDRTAATTEQLLARFVGALDLAGVKAVDEAAILQRYRQQPEQLLVKLQYLALQCGMLVMSGPSERSERQAIIRRVFLDYVLAPPAAADIDLATYLNQTSSAGTGTPSDPKLAELIKAAEAEQAGLANAAWRTAWFRDGAAASEAERWAVIVASPDTEHEAWQMLRRHQGSWPEVHFELHVPYDLDSQNYALVAGRRLPEADARALVERVKTMGMAADSFVWQLPANGDLGPIAGAQP